MTDTTAVQNLIAAVRAHAMENWNRDGWDFLVESWEDEDIAEVLEDAGAETAPAAIAACQSELRILDDHRREMAAMARW